MRHPFPVAMKIATEWYSQEDIMSDLNGSLYALIARRWLAPGNERKPGSKADGKDDRVTVTDQERQLPEREESYYWAWQYPGHW